MNKSITPSTDDVALLRALSRRSAVLRVDPDEASIVVERQGRPVVVAIVQPAQIARFETAGWLRAGASGHRLSRSGVAALRRVLADPAAKPVVLAHSNQQPQRPTTPIAADWESPLAWLRTRRDRAGVPMISVAEFQAGERLRADFHFAGLGQRVTARWDREVQSSAGRGDHLSDRAYDARDRYHRALAAVGPELSGILVDVCCFLKGIGEIERTSGWPERSAKVVLRLALSRLARHYGLLPPTPPREGTIRNWRAGDAPG